MFMDSFMNENLVVLFGRVEIFVRYRCCFLNAQSVLSVDVCFYFDGHAIFLFFDQYRLFESIIFLFQGDR